MDIERTIETQRLRLLRLVAGLVVLAGFLSVGPVSRVFSVSICGFIGSILSRAEAAVRYLLIAQAYAMIERGGIALDRSHFSETLAHAVPVDETDMSPFECRRRLKALHSVLMDLPRHALRLIRRIERRMGLMACSDRLSPREDARLAAPLRDRRPAPRRIERPPDKTLSAFAVFRPSPEFRAGGKGG